jgi:hypothetical protein
MDAADARRWVALPWCLPGLANFIPQSNNFVVFKQYFSHTIAPTAQRSSRRSVRYYYISPILLHTLRRQAPSSSFDINS